jgi:hypothetical protein
MAAEYAEAAADPRRVRACRRAVIEAKDHARWAARRAGTDADLRARKEEMLLWMLTWLENPGVFREWVGLRNRQLTTEMQRARR